MTDDERALWAELRKAEMEHVERDRIRQFLDVDSHETRYWNRRAYERELTARLEKALHG